MSHTFYSWNRTAPLELPTGPRQEHWILSADEQLKTFPVRATYGKDINLGTIKQKYCFDGEVAAVEAKRKYYDDKNDFVRVSACPVCESSIENARAVKKIWQGTYHQCPHCAHVFTDLRPTDALLQAYYESGTEGKQYYAQIDEIDLRIREIYTPKIEWLIRSYQAQYGTPPRSIVDIGAGTGHFLRAATHAGLAAAGLEIDTFYREFCKEHFGISLVATPEELTGSHPDGFDIITSFNVIEHVTNPNDLMTTYRKLLSDRPFIVAETPNFHSLTVWLQRIFPHRLRGYFAPYEHVQMFTQSSLATLYYLNGFAVTDSWVFGQDARELAFQFSAEGGGELSEFIGNHFNDVQKGIDIANVGDLIILAGVPF